LKDQRVATIDITMSDELKELLTPPKCLDLRLPKPSIPKLTLPTGGSIKAITDITKGIPSDCSANFNLALQLAPIMASIECLVKILKFIGIVVELLKSMTNPGKILTGIPKIVEAADDLKDCILVPTPLIMIPFVRDLLLMLAKMLRCAAGALRSAIEILDGIGLDLASAEQDGNDTLAQQLQCAQENAQMAMDGAMVSLDPVLMLLDLAKPFLEIAGVPLEIPQIASDGSLESMKTALEGMDTFAQTLEDIAEAL
jgi:hypothetical protein